MSEMQRDGSEMRCKRCGANECRIHGFCSVECEHYFDYEEEITDLNARIAELEAEAKAVKENSQWLARLTESSRKENEHLRQTLSVYAAKQRWISVSERLPEENKCVLVYDAGGNMTVDFLVTSGEVEKYFWLAKYRILFWMPLPELPKED